MKAALVGVKEGGVNILLSTRSTVANNKLMLAIESKNGDYCALIQNNKYRTGMEWFVYGALEMKGGVLDFAFVGGGCLLY